MKFCSFLTRWLWVIELNFYFHVVLELNFFLVCIQRNNEKKKEELGIKWMRKSVRAWRNRFSFSSLISSIQQRYQIFSTSRISRYNLMTQISVFLEIRSTNKIWCRLDKLDLNAILREKWKVAQWAVKYESLARKHRVSSDVQRVLGLDTSEQPLVTRT